MKELICIITAAAVLLCGTVQAAEAPVSGADSGTDSAAMQETVNKPKKNDESAEETDSLDEIEKARQALQYGLESEILEVTGKIDKQDFEALQDDFIRLFTDTKSRAVREALFSLYQKYTNPLLVSSAVKLLEHYAEQNRTLLKAVLAYLASVKPEQTDGLRTVLQTLLTEEAAEYGAEAAAVLGEIGSDEDALFLADYFETCVLDDTKQELALKQAIAAALEKLHSEATRDFLIERARDENENAYIRAGAAAGLAQMGNPDIVPLLIAFFEESEPLLRAAAIKGAAAFDTEDTQKLLLEGFKDSYYKVRLEALQTVQKTKQREALPYVLYRAKHDPVEAVRFSAVETLAILDVPEGNEWLSETFRNPKKSEKLRVKVLNAALKHNPAMIAGDLEAVVLPSVRDDKQKKLRYELGKELAKTENAAAAEICKSFLQSTDVLTKSIGLDMFKTNRYTEVRPVVEEIAQDEKQGTLQRRAKQLLEEKTGAAAGSE